MTDQPFNSASFYKLLNEHKLMGSRCLKSGEVFLPPRALCPTDFSSEMEWVELSGRGKLAAFSIIYIGPSQMIAEGYDRKNPYCAGIVELEEGPKISAQILGVDLDHPETIRIGMPLEVAYVERGQGEGKQAYLAFKPVNSDQ